MSPPRIPRHRAPVISCSGHWYENPAARVLLIVLGGAFGGAALNALLAWWAQS